MLTERKANAKRGAPGSRRGPHVTGRLGQWRSQNRVVGRAQVGHTYGAAQRRRKVFTIGGGGTDDGACLSTHALGGCGDMPPHKIF